MTPAAVESDAQSEASEPEAREVRYRARLAEALPPLRERMEEAARRVGREPAGVRLVAVTKGHPLAALKAACAHGLIDLGENRPEALLERRAALQGQTVRWHLIGHVQRRKALDAVNGTDLFHALDSERLAQKLGRTAEEEGRTLPTLVQVNTSGEGSKGGFSTEEVLEALGRLLAIPGLEIRGLMTMAPFVEDDHIIRTAFARLRQLHEQAETLADYHGTELSMGMTNDFEIAIEEGSTMIRVGTALFGDRL